jgi:hypothetical protein
MYRLLISGIVASTVGLASIAPVNGDPLCHPKLTVTDVQFSEMIPPTLERKWTAIVSIDDSRCQSKSTGDFQILFNRLSETGPDLEFSERFAWRPPSVEVVVKFSANESVQGYWVENVTSCVCRK